MPQPLLVTELTGKNLMISSLILFNIDMNDKEMLVLKSMDPDEIYLRFKATLYL